MVSKKPQLRVFKDKEEIKAASKADGDKLYVVVDGGVFDMTQFRAIHPGGEELFLFVKAGHDISNQFNGGGKGNNSLVKMHKHSANARRMLTDGYQVGTLPDGYHATGGEKAEDQAGIDDVKVDFDKGIVFQAGLMGDRYQKWVNSTTVTFPVHYFDNHGIGAFLNLATKCPWYVPCLVWLPHCIWLAGAAMGYDLFLGCFSKTDCQAVYADENMSPLRQVGAGVAMLYRNLLFDPYGNYAYDYSVNSSTDGLGDEAYSWTTLWQFFIVGYAFFTFFEWFIHKHFFHMHTQSFIGNGIHFIFHGSHHLSPQDHMRLVFPPVPLTILRTALTWGFVYWVALNRPMYHAAMSGIFLGYLSYDIMHYGNHHKIPIPGMGWFQNLGPIKQLKHHHLRHHFGDAHERIGNNCNFGLSLGASIWDDILGTVCTERNPVTGEIEKKSKMLRVLGLEA